MKEDLLKDTDKLMKFDDTFDYLFNGLLCSLWQTLFE